MVVVVVVVVVIVYFLSLLCSCGVVRALTTSLCLLIMLDNVDFDVLKCCCD